MKVKVCGMTQVKQLKELEELRVDYAGLIFHKDSPRYVLNGIENPSVLNNENIHLKKVGVFVNESLQTIMNISRDWSLDLVQLHGDESAELCKQVSRFIPVVKAFRVGDIFEESLYLNYVNVVDHFLFDTLGIKYGGTGKQFDWNLISGSSLQKSFFLSGGIGPEDVEKINDFCNSGTTISAIDLNSRFEIEPGVKNMTKLAEFLSNFFKK